MNRVVKEPCDNCDDNELTVTEHYRIGFIPITMVTGETGEGWINAQVCSNCGSISPISISDEQHNWAEERYLRALADTGHITEEEAKDLLGL